MKSKHLPPMCPLSDDLWSPQVSIAVMLQHPNITKLLGYCIDKESWILAYEYASIGTVTELLHGE